MKTLMSVLMTCAVLGMTASTALAGGDNGGSKDDGEIVVRNNGTQDQILLVVVGDLPDDRLTTFINHGGQIVPPGGTASFDVAAGSQPVHAVFVDDTTLQVVGALTTKSYNVPKNQTIHVGASVAGGNTVLN